MQDPLSFSTFFFFFFDKNVERALFFWRPCSPVTFAPLPAEKSCPKPMEEMPGVLREVHLIFPPSEGFLVDLSFFFLQAGLIP